MFHHVGIRVSDVDRSIKFYRDTFNFQPVIRYTSMSGQDVCFLRSGDMTIEVYKQKEDTDGIRGITHISLEDDHIDESFAKLNGLGLEMSPGEPRYGVGDSPLKLFHFKDPNGVSIEMMNPLPRDVKFKTTR